jgi:serine/threonine protein kinase
MLSGVKAFPSRQLLEVIEKRKTNDHIPLNQVNANLPRQLYRIVSKCMELQPDNRYQDVNELLKQLTTMYKRLTTKDPIETIHHFIETGKVSPRRIQVSRNLLIPIITGVIPSIILLVSISFIFRSPHSDHTIADTSSRAQPHNPISKPPERTLVTSEKPAPVDTVVMLPAPQESTTETVLESSPVVTEDAQATLQPAQSGIPKQPVAEVLPVKKKNADSDRNDLLAELESLVDAGNLSAALEQFNKKTINDGAFFSLYARCFYESGEWKKAYETAEMATTVPSKRISEETRRGQSLLYKAKYFSTLFDNEQSKDHAQEAINAWWKVKEHFDGTSQSAKSAFAESEIARISKVLSD